MKRLKDAESKSTSSENQPWNRLSSLKELFPEIWIEGRISYEKLASLLDVDIVTDPERYSFTWTGKRDSMRLLQIPSRATLVPSMGKSINFKSTRNIFIEGENLEVLKILYKPYFNRIKMIYIDPPYNTGQDLIYCDSYSDPLESYLQISGQQDYQGNVLLSNPDTDGRYHSRWLSMMYPRLFMARQLLSEDGVIFVSIDDHEISNLRMIMNEIFGEENFIDCIIWKKRYGGGGKEKFLVTLHEYVLFYAKNKNKIDNIQVSLSSESIKRYYKLRDKKYGIRGPYRTHPLEATRSVDYRENLVYPIPAPDGQEVLPERQWWWEKDRTMQALEDGDLEFIKTKNGSWTIHTKQYLKDENGAIRKTKPFSIIDDVYTQHGTAEIQSLFGDSRVFPFPKPTGLIQKLLEIAHLSDGDIVLDFFAGSCTTAHSVLKLNREDGIMRRFIMVQLPEPLSNSSKAFDMGFRTLADIGQERICRSIKQIGEEQETLSEEDLGFRVFKLTESNLISWPGIEKRNPEEYIKQMELQVEPLKSDWSKDSLIFEIALKEGYDLSCTFEVIADLANTVYKVIDKNRQDSFLLCLDDHIENETIDLLSLCSNDSFLCRDSALDDSLAANLAQQCRLKTI